MPDDTLESRLRTVHEALANAGPLNARELELLKLVSADAQGALARSGAAASPAHRGLREQLDDAATRLEASHPDLTATLMQVSKALGDMGI